jgi:hypothetical protein
MIYSSKRDLDILPAAASKGKAAAFLANRWQIDAERIIVAGDSGNDADMFRAEYRGIVVGNAQSELKSLKTPRIYHATSMFAGGVLEGMRYWLRQMPKPRPVEPQRRSKSSTNVLRHCSKLAAQDGRQELRNWLFEATFPWMLI